jgi:hypothetical protein
MEFGPMNMQVLDARRDMSGGYKVDVSRGERIGRVSSEWFSRPDDERYLSLSELADSVRSRSERSRTRVVETALIHVEASRTDPERLSLILPGSDTPSRRRTGVSASSPARSALPPPICANSRPPWPASTCNTA